MATTKDTHAIRVTRPQAHTRHQAYQLPGVFSYYFVSCHNLGVGATLPTTKKSRIAFLSEGDDTKKNPVRVSGWPHASTADVTLFSHNMYGGVSILGAAIQPDEKTKTKKKRCF